jgi:hypothetical protein
VAALRQRGPRRISPLGLDTEARSRRSVRVLPHPDPPPGNVSQGKRRPDQRSHRGDRGQGGDGDSRASISTPRTPPSTSSTTCRFCPGAQPTWTIDNRNQAMAGDGAGPGRRRRPCSRQGSAANNMLRRRTSTKAPGRWLRRREHACQKPGTRWVAAGVGRSGHPSSATREQRRNKRVDLLPPAPAHTPAARVTSQGLDLTPAPQESGGLTPHTAGYGPRAHRAELESCG